jgi:hypothetical protein
LRGDEWVINLLNPEDQVVVGAPGFAPAVVDRSRPEPIEVRMVRGTSLEGRVLAGGVPIEARLSLGYLLGPDGVARWPEEGPATSLSPGTVLCWRGVDCWGREEGTRFEDLPAGHGLLYAYLKLDDDEVLLGTRRVTLGSAAPIDLHVQAPIEVEVQVQLPEPHAWTAAAEVEVWARHRDALETWAAFARRAAPVGPGATGRFRVQGVVPGERFDLFARATLDGRPWFGRTDAVRLDRDGSTPVVVLGVSPPIRGRVVDAGGAPCARASVRIKPVAWERTPWAEGWPNAQTVAADAEGRFSSDVPPLGDLVLTAGSARGDLRSIPRSISRGTDELTLTVVAMAKASGRVQAGPGLQIPRELEARVVTDEGVELASTFTWGDGFFQVEWPAAEPVRLVFHPRGSRDGQNDDQRLVTAPLRGSATDLRFPLERGPSCAGTVVDPDGWPVPLVPVRARGRWTDRHTTTDAAGRWSFRGLCDEEVEVSAQGAYVAGPLIRTKGGKDVRLVLDPR